MIFASSVLAATWGERGAGALLLPLPFLSRVVATGLGGRKRSRRRRRRSEGEEEEWRRGKG